MIRLDKRALRGMNNNGAIRTWFYELSERFEMWIEEREQRAGNAPFNLTVVDRQTRRITVSIFAYHKRDMVHAANAFAGDWP